MNKMLKYIGITFSYICIIAVLGSYSFIVLGSSLYSSMKYCASSNIYDKVFGQIICTYHPAATTIITLVLMIGFLFLIKRISAFSWNRITSILGIAIIVVYVSVVLFNIDENLYQAYQMDTVSETHKDQCYVPGLRSSIARSYTITDRYFWVREFIFGKKDSMCPTYEYFRGR